MTSGQELHFIVINIYVLTLLLFLQYIFFPWISLVILAFLITELRVRRAGVQHNRNLEAKLRGAGNILTVDNAHELPLMSVDTFLVLTKHGKSLSIIDGYVIDIGEFISVHPGGSNVLRFAIGCDITSYFIGELDIGGIRHKHSQTALLALKPLIKWKVDSEREKESTRISDPDSRRTMGLFFAQRQKRGSLFSSKHKSSSFSGHVFRNSTIVGNKVLSKSGEVNEKSILHLKLSVKRDQNMDSFVGETSLPTTTFIFRVVDSKGNAFERPYSASQCQVYIPEEKSSNTILPLTMIGKRSQAEMVVYDFFITLVPRGKMSSALAKQNVGKNIMVKGPLVSKVCSAQHSMAKYARAIFLLYFFFSCILVLLQPFLTRLKHQQWKNVCLIIQGTGITVGLQLIDYCLKMKHPPKITLLWFVRYDYSLLCVSLRVVTSSNSSNLSFIVLL